MRGANKRLCFLLAVLVLGREFSPVLSSDVTNDNLSIKEDEAEPINHDEDTTDAKDDSNSDEMREEDVKLDDKMDEEGDSIDEEMDNKDESDLDKMDNKDESNDDEIDAGDESNDEKTDEDDSNEDEDDDEDDSEDAHEAKTTELAEIEPKTPGGSTGTELQVRKRGALFAASIFMSLLNLGLKVLIKVKGCCIFPMYKAICKNSKKFAKISKALDKQSKLVEKEFKAANKLRDWVMARNDGNKKIWKELQRIAELEELIVKNLNPHLVKQYNGIQSKIQRDVRNNNLAVIGMSYQELADRFNVGLSSTKDAALTFSGIGGLAMGKVVSMSFKQYQINKISKTLKTSYGSKLAKAGKGARKVFGFTKGASKMHIKQSAKAIYKGKFAKVGKFMKVAGKVMSLASIAMDAYEIYKTFRKCHQLKKASKKGLRNIQEAKAKNDKLYSDVMKYKNGIKNNEYKFIKTQINNKDLHEVLKSIRDLAKGASKQTKNMKYAAKVTQQFLTRIKRASDKKITILQKDLIKGLEKVKFFLSCLLDRVKFIMFIETNCKDGNFDIVTLYNKAKKSFELKPKRCHDENGFPYTTLGKIKKLTIASGAKKGFNGANCVLNSKSKLREVCRMKKEDYKPAQIAAKVKITVADVSAFLKKCPETPITPAAERMVCKLRERCMAEPAIASISSISVQRLKNIPCPCSELLAA